MAEIRITLRSDLCSGSGESAGNRIDSDIYMDAYGLPYIPARRIKGCLRDAAMELKRMGCPEAQRDGDIAALFGDGDGRMGCLHLEDAQLPGSESVKAYLRSELPEPLRRYAAPAEIAKIFCYVRGNTRMEDGVAARGSLRFTRVLSQDSLFHPGEDAQMICRVEQPEPRLDALLTKCCQATRRMGMHRNRGLGAVRLEYLPGKAQVGADAAPQAVEPGARVEIAYRVALNAPIALNGCGEQLTAIPARSVIGCMAEAYLRDRGAAEDEGFARLFLTGEAVWSALTPCIDGERSVPAPLMLAQLSRTGEYVNRLSGDEGWRGEKLRTLEGSYAALREDGYRLANAHSRTSYHHRRAAAGVSEQLYEVDALDRDMLYAGSVTVPAELAGLACGLLLGARLRFGHSKNAEYAACALEGAPQMRTLEEEKLCVAAGEPVFAVLESDLVLVEDGLYATSGEQIRAALAGRMGARDEAPEGCIDYCLYRDLGGYHARWRMQKARVPAVRGGSVFCFASNGAPIDRAFHLGEFVQEDLGRVRVFSREEMRRRSRVVKGAITEPKRAQAASEGAMSEEAKRVRSAMIVAAARDAIQRNAFEYANNPANQRALSGCPLGRLRRMLADARDYGDFLERVASIRTSDVSGQNRGRAAGSRELVGALYGRGGAPELRFLLQDAQLLPLVEADAPARARVLADWKLLLEGVLHFAHYKKTREGA